VLLRAGARTELAAENVALGGPYVAVRTGDRITVLDRATLAVVGARDVRAATQLAVSRGWLVWRVARPDGGDRLYASPLPALQETRLVAGSGGPERIGRPALAGDRLVYGVSTATASRIVLDDLARRTRRVVLRSPSAQLAQPALRHRRLLYVEATYCSQRLRLAGLGQRDHVRTLLRIGSTARRDAGHDPGYTTQGSEPSLCPPGTPPRTDTMLWTTALGDDVAYVTLLRRRADGRSSTTLVRERA
jgi:hypothetical protein